MGEVAGGKVGPANLVGRVSTAWEAIPGVDTAALNAVP
jgi:hypothetical protein